MATFSRYNEDRPYEVQFVFIFLNNHGFYEHRPILTFFKTLHQHRWRMCQLNLTQHMTWIWTKNPRWMNTFRRYLNVVSTIVLFLLARYCNNLKELFINFVLFWDFIYCIVCRFNLGFNIIKLLWHIYIYIYRLETYSMQFYWQFAGSDE